MNFGDIEKTVRHIKETCICLHCRSGYESNDIQLIATTKVEGLFEIICKKCGASSIITVVLTPESKIQNAKIKQEISRNHRKISENDILDIKNFLNNFDGNFKKIFTEKQ